MHRSSSTPFVAGTTLNAAALLNKLSSPVYICSLHGAIMFYNDAALHLWGKNPFHDTQWCGASGRFDIRGKPLNAEDVPFAQALREGKLLYNYEIILKSSKGKMHRVLCSPQLVTDGEHDSVVSVTLTDISAISFRGSRDLLVTYALKKWWKKFWIMPYYLSM